MTLILGDRDRVIVYCCYLDSSKSESRGRKIPKKYAVTSPKVEEIVQAASQLGLEPEVEEKVHPSWWWEETSRVLVKKVWSKRSLLIAIAKKIQENRRARS